MRLEAECGRVVEWVYTRHLKCLGESHAGSNPVSPTTEFALMRFNIIVYNQSIMEHKLKPGTERDVNRY